MSLAGKLVGIAGLAGSGKDTVAGLVVRHRSRARALAFADKIKDICREVYGFSDEQLFGPLKDAPDRRYPREGDAPDSDGFLTPRYAMQQLGTQWGRQCYQRTWTDLTLRRAEELVSRARVSSKNTGAVAGTSGKGSWVLDICDLVLITDVRFSNEMAAIREAGGFLWLVRRPGAGLRSEAGRHASECDLQAAGDDEYDVVIENNGTLEELAQKVTALL